MDTRQIVFFFAAIALFFGLATENKKVMDAVVGVLVIAGLAIAAMAIASAVRLLSAGIDPFQ